MAFLFRLKFAEEPELSYKKWKDKDCEKGEENIRKSNFVFVPFF